MKKALPRENNSQALLLTPDQQPTPALRTLLSICNISHDNYLESIVAATQKEQPEGFLRPDKKERWELLPYYHDHKDPIIHCCKDLGMIDAIKPAQSFYTYAVIHGSTLQNVRSRIAFLIQLWNEGIRWQQLVILSGERPLDSQRESPQLLLDSQNKYLSFKKEWRCISFPTTESEMISVVLEQSVVPDEWKNIPVTIINAPLQQTSNGLRRPATIDTVRVWLNTHPAPGTVLAISNQPYVQYQHSVVCSIVPSTLFVETIGEKAKENTTPEILVDTVARWLYTIYHSLPTSLV